MRMWLVVAVVAAQLGVLAFMAGSREWIRRYGRTVYLRTAPVDPRDAFRGDYVRLDYEAGHVRTNLCRDVLPTAAQGRVRRGTEVYAGLRLREDGTADVQSLTTTRPETGLFLHGRTDNYYSGRQVPVRYGVEAYFVQQGQGSELERARPRDGVQVPLEMELAVSPSGTAVIKGHRWGPLGIGIALQADTNRLTRGVVVTLQNASTQALSIVDLPAGRSFRLEPDALREWGNDDWRWVGAGEPRPAPDASALRVLKPGESCTVTLDFTQPEWYVVKAGDKPKPLAGTGWSGWFRLVYAPPTAAECAALQPAAPIWHGELLSRAFSGGRVD